MSRKIKLGVIGAGGFAGRHLEGIHLARNSESVAVCDVDLERARARAEEFNLPYYYGSIDELLANPEVEAVTIVTNDQTHREATVKALHAGKHVLCEKPMALSKEDCKAMIAAQKETGNILMVGQIGRYTEAFNKAVEIVNSGEIGELFCVESEYAHDYSHIGGAGGWRVTPERHAIIGGGCHAVDLMRRIAGNPIEVFAYANHKVLKDWPVDDCTIAVMKFPNNVIGRVLCSIGCKRKYTMRTVIYGSLGTLIVDPQQPYITMYRDRFTDDKFITDRSQTQQTMGIEIRADINDHNFNAEVEDFCNAIITGKLVDCTGEEGAITVAACMAIVESAAKGEKVTIEYDF